MLQLSQSFHYGTMYECMGALKYRTKAFSFGVTRQHIVTLGTRAQIILTWCPLINSKWLTVIDTLCPLDFKNVFYISGFVCLL